MRVISQYIADANNAGPKAKIDIERILKNTYNAEIYTNKVKEFEENTIKYKVKKILFFKKSLKNKGITVIQIPFTNKKKILKLAKNKIGIVHDIDGLRFNNADLLKEEVQALNSYQVLIVHNNAMKKILIENGVSIPLITLEIFDYLLKEGKPTENQNESSIIEPIVIYPGNLEPRKAKFLYSLEETKMKFKIAAYGPYYEENNNSKIMYKGSFSPDELPYKLEGQVGLVWSGEIDDSDEKIGEKYYNKYNTPHKLSSFLAAGIPIIVWEKSAIAELIDKYNIGYKINNLYEINEIDFSDYEEKKNNAGKLSQKVIEGYFTKTAFEQAIEILNKEENK